MQRYAIMQCAGVVAILGLACAGTSWAQPGKAAASSGPRIAYRFGPQGQIGMAALHKNDQVPLTFAPDGQTSNTVLRVDGKSVLFGSGQGQWNFKPKALSKSKDGPMRHGYWGLWSYGKIKVTQVVEVLPSHTGKPDTCLIYYVLENGDTQPHDVGLRAMIDTQINENDGNSFAVGGQVVTRFADYKSAKDLPESIQVRETSDPGQLGFIAYLTVKVGGAFEAPERCSLTHWPGPTAGWDVKVESIDDDAAVALYWNPRRLEPSARRMIGYGYGQGILSLAASK